MGSPAWLLPSLSLIFRSEVRLPDVRLWHQSGLRRLLQIFGVTP
jgi:hypothetical protein